MAWWPKSPLSLMKKEVTVAKLYGLEKSVFAPSHDRGSASASTNRLLVRYRLLAYQFCQRPPEVYIVSGMVRRRMRRRQQEKDGHTPSAVALYSSFGKAFWQRVTVAERWSIGEYKPKAVNSIYNRTQVLHLPSVLAIFKPQWMYDSIPACYKISFANPCLKFTLFPTRIYPKRKWIGQRTVFY